MALTRRDLQADSAASMAYFGALPGAATREPAPRVTLVPMLRYSLGAILCLAAVLAWTAGRPDEVPFQKHTLDLGSNESCAVADINGDGKPDIVSGENWYEGPRWTKHKFRTLPYTNNYIDNFSDLPLDVNGDGRIDIVGCSWFSKRVFWSENPGRGGGEWKEHMIDTGKNVEFAFLVDIDNDGKAREVLPQYGGANDGVAWYEANSGTFVKHAVSAKGPGHGIGAGDVNGDHRNDILTHGGWFEAPPDPRAGDWKWHPDWDLGDTGFIQVLDVNGDGRPDLVASMAHNYGVFWVENTGEGKWAKRVIDDSWSQPHAVTLADLNGDGRKDIVTGKRFMAHNGHDPGEREPLGVYWYEYFKDGNRIEWVKHVVDYSTRTGGGMQIPVLDIDGDGDMDFVVAGKSGLFLFENLTKRK